MPPSGAVAPVGGGRGERYGGGRGRGLGIEYVADNYGGGGGRDQLQTSKAGEVAGNTAVVERSSERNRETNSQRNKKERTS